MDERLHALDLAKGKDATAANLTSVAAATSPDAARWAFGQWALRERGAAKFAKTADMLFDREGLEMATHERVAQYHASRFPPGAPVVDMTCGIGSDLIALARRGPAIGYETDPYRAEMARHNVAAHGLQASVLTVDSMGKWEAEYAFCDPSRRVGGRRTLKTSEFEPDPARVVARMAGVRLGGIKLSPMLADRDLERLGPRLEFVSFGGECREALVWLGPEAPPGRFAVHIESGETLPAGADPIRAPVPNRFFYEADPAAIRAHCLGELGDCFDLQALGDSNGYLTGHQIVRNPWLDGYEVLKWHSADAKRTRSELRALGGGTPIVKSRTPDVDVLRLRRKLHGEGEELVVAVYAEGRSLKHMICRCILATAR